MAIDSFFMLLIPEKSSMSSIIGQSSPNLNSWLRIGRVVGQTNVARKPFTGLYLPQCAHCPPIAKALPDGLDASQKFVDSHL
jgi:hypothetical protein